MSDGNPIYMRSFLHSHQITRKKPKRTKRVSVCVCVSVRSYKLYDSCCTDDLFVSIFKLSTNQRLSGALVWYVYLICSAHKLQSNSLDSRLLEWDGIFRSPYCGGGGNGGGGGAVVIVVVVWHSPQRTAGTFGDGVKPRMKMTGVDCASETAKQLQYCYYYCYYMFASKESPSEYTHTLSRIDKE